MLSRKTFWSVTLAVVVVGLASGVLLGDFLLHKPVQTTEAAWAQVFEAPSEMVADVDTIVLAKMVGVEPGRVAYSANGEDALAFEVVEFEVLQGLKGARRGSRIFVERAGGTSPDGQSVILDIDGGAYEKGATYLLFLNQQEDGPFHYLVNDQGRYLVDQGRLYAAADKDSVAQFFDGRSLNEGLSLVREHLRPQARPVE